MKKNLMKCAAREALLLSVAACKAKDNAPNSAETPARMNVTTILTVKLIKK